MSVLAASGSFAWVETNPTSAVGVEISRGSGPTNFDAGLGDDLADEGQADIDVTLGEQGHCTAAALGRLDFGFHRLGDPHGLSVTRTD
jgi:hypothetical protein